MGLTRGASAGAGEVSYTDYQWHHEFIETPDAVPDNLADFTVAILDTGVSYINIWTGIPGAETLSTSPIRHPYDFVNGDSYAGDDHQHGTHVASLIASKGAIRGVAPGVGLMPVKVLDENNVGDELALVDGLYHAVDNGADVINLSLTLPPGYSPSPAMEEALDYAYVAGAVLVGAAGNQGAEEIPWPAASPLVIGVAGLRAKRSMDPKIASYTNRGTAITIAGPGGDPTKDRNRDGYVDGLLGETIAPGDPTKNELWFMSGTSQAAAVVTGAAAQLVAAGASPDEVVAALQESSSDTLDEKKVGGGLFSLTKALDALPSIVPAEPTWVTVLPYLKDVGDGEVKASAQFTVVDASGMAISDAVVRGTITGPGGKLFSCTTDEDGVCTKRGARVLAADVSSDIWSFTVHQVERDDAINAPRRAVFVTEAGESFADALAEEVDTQGATIAVQWTEGRQEGLGKLAASWAMVDSAQGPATSPFGVLLGPDIVDADSATTLDVTFDDSSIALLDVTIDGTRLVTSPMGLPVRLISLDGTRLVSSPMGLPLLDFYSPAFALGGDRLATSPMGLPFRLDYGITLGAGVESSEAFTDMIDSGDGLSTEGWQAASWVASVLREDFVTEEHDLTAEPFES
jgi:hypothetical protein